MPQGRNWSNIGPILAFTFETVRTYDAGFRAPKHPGANFLHYFGTITNQMWGSSEISFLPPTLTGLCFRIPSPGPVNRYMPKAHEPVWSWCTWHRWCSYQTLKGRTPKEINDDWYYNYLFAEWEHIRMKRGVLGEKDELEMYIRLR